MEKKSPVFSLIIALFLLSCNSTTNTDKSISDINTDFPTSEKLELKFFNKYNVFSEINNCFVDDSVLWAVSENDDNLGYCINLNTGTQLSVIATKGKAAYEFNKVHKVIISGDSIQFHTETDAIKTFAKKDIIENKPMDQRKFSLTPSLDTIFVCEKMKLPNGSVLATMCGIKYMRGASSDNNFNKYNNSKLNKKMVAIINYNEANSYQTINYEKFNIQKSVDSEIEDLDFKIKFTFALSHIGLKNNDMAVFSLEHQFLLYTFDLNSKKVVKEKIYAKLLTDRFGIVNDMRISNLNMKCNDKYIVCYINGYLSKEDKESKTFKNAVLVFDWDLNPVKRFEIPGTGRTNDPYFISEDCSAIYLWEMKDDGLVLYKSDLNY